jgi:hypothetical protein
MMLSSGIFLGATTFDLPMHTSRLLHGANQKGKNTVLNQISRTLAPSPVCFAGLLSSL